MNKKIIYVNKPKEGAIVKGRETKPNFNEMKFGDSTAPDDKDFLKEMKSTKGKR